MPPETDDTEELGQPTQQQVEPEEPPKKPKRKHTVETAEAIPFILLAILFDIISLATFMAPLIAVVGKFIFTAIWLMHGVMPWSKKYWTWYLISFVCEFIPFVSILPMFTIGELKMIAQSRVEDKLQETTGLAQAAIQVAKFKVRQNVKRQIAAGGLSEEELKKKEGLSKSLRFASARTLRRTLVNKAQGRGPKYRDPSEEGEEADTDTESPDIQSGRAPLSRPSRGGAGGAGSEAFDGVVAGASMAANAGRSASLPPTKPLPPKDPLEDDDTATETANAVGANANGVQGTLENPEPVTTASSEETEISETVSSEPPRLDEPDDTSLSDTPDIPPDITEASDEPAVVVPIAANDIDARIDDSALAQNTGDTIVAPQNVAMSSAATPPVTDIYREPLPANDNTASSGTDETTTEDTEDDEDQYPPVRRAA